MAIVSRMDQVQNRQSFTDIRLTDKEQFIHTDARNNLYVYMCMCVCAHAHSIYKPALVLYYLGVHLCDYQHHYEKM